MRRRQRRMRGNLPGPEGLARRGASAALHGLSIVSTMDRAARLASAPSPCQRGSRRLLRQAPGGALARTAREGGAPAAWQVVENQEPIKSLAGPVSSGQRTDKTWRTAHCADIVLIHRRPTDDSASDHRFI